MQVEKCGLGCQTSTHCKRHVRPMEYKASLTGGFFYCADERRVVGFQRVGKGWLTPLEWSYGPTKTTAVPSRQPFIRRKSLDLLQRAVRATLRLAGRKGGALMELAYYAPGSPAFKNFNAWDFYREAYIECSTAFACINSISSAISGIEWKLYDGKQKKKRLEIDKHPLITLLENPNPKDTDKEITEAEIIYYLLTGDSYLAFSGAPIDVGSPLTGSPLEMWVMRPDLMAPVPDVQGIATRYDYRLSNAGVQAWHPSRIMHRKGFHPFDPIFGLGPTQVAGKEIDTLNASTEMNFKMLKNGGRPDGVVMVKRPLGDEEYARFKKNIRDEFNNPMAAVGGWRLIEGDNVEFKEFQVKFTDMQFREGELAKIIATCRTYKVPPEIIGVTQSRTYANYEEARKAFYLDCVLPHMDMIKSKRQKELVPKFKDLMAAPKQPKAYVDYDTDGIEALQENRVQLWQRVTTAEQAGEITNNEWRQQVGMDKAEDKMADTRLVAINRVPVESLDLEEQDENTNTNEPAKPKPGEEEENGTGSGTGAGTGSGTGAGTGVGKRKKDDDALMMHSKLAGKGIGGMFDKGRTPFINTATALIRKTMSGDRAAVKEALMHHGSALNHSEAQSLVKNVLQKRKPAWHGAFKTMYTRCGMDFARRVDKGLAQTIGRPKARQFKDLSADWLQTIMDYLAQQGGAKITGITDYTRDRLMASLIESIDDGDTLQEMADNLDAIGAFGAGRAMTIARTETIAASNLGSQSAAEAFGIPLVKSWLAVNDDRTREDHSDADGQQVGLDEPFSVGGSQLQFPGDSSLGADAEEVINCRCTQTYDAAS